MRPEDALVPAGQTEPSGPVPLDIELEALDLELVAAGNRARRTLNGQRQPTRYFSIELRRQLFDDVDGRAAGTGRDIRPR
jgi:hypothetical protein